MKTRYLHAIVFLVGLSASVLASAQQDSQDSVENWPAPATWSPPRSHAGLTMMGEVTNPLPFIGVSPCRILDTRGNGAPIQGGIFTGGSDVRSYVLAGICGIPASARAVSLNFTVLSSAAVFSSSAPEPWVRRPSASS